MRRLWFLGIFLLLSACGHPSSIKQLSSLQLNYWNMAVNQFNSNGDQEKEIDAFIKLYKKGVEGSLKEIDILKNDQAMALAEKNSGPVAHGSPAANRELYTYLYSVLGATLQQKIKSDAILKEVDSDKKTLNELDGAIKKTVSQITENQKVIDTYLSQKRGFKLKDVYKYVTNSEALKNLLKSIFERIRKQI